jgi:hypothetical protein
MALALRLIVIGILLGSVFDVYGQHFSSCTNSSVNRVFTFIFYEGSRNRIVIALICLIGAVIYNPIWKTSFHTITNRNTVNLAAHETCKTFIN